MTITFSFAQGSIWQHVNSPSFSPIKTINVPGGSKKKKAAKPTEHKKPSRHEDTFQRPKQAAKASTAPRKESKPKPEAKQPRRPDAQVKDVRQNQPRLDPKPIRGRR
ncbi:MAG: hypothetical protein Q8L14_20165 [Myxococcales bacterium]|nr:hypothetical protein [Myxococcales bacterium]